MKIVLDKSQRDALLSLRTQAPQMFKKYSTFEPIEIATKDPNGDSFYIIPYHLLEDEDFKIFKEYVFSNLATTIQIRAVDQSEYMI